MASRCFGWAGFQMLRFAQNDSPLSFPRVRGNQKGASPATAHDGGAIIWPGGNSGAVAQSLLPRTRGNWGWHE